MYRENLKALRTELNLSAQKLADKIGSTQVSVSNYETGKYKPSFEFMQALNKVLNVNLNWFVSGQGEMFIGQDKETSAGVDEAQIFKAIDKYMKNKGIIT